MLALVASFVVYEAAYLIVYFTRQPPSGSPLFGDFFSFWSVARMSHLAARDNIYNLAALQAFQASSPGGFQGFIPFPSPPLFLLFLWPLGWFDYLTAYSLWMAATFGAYCFALADRDWRSPRLWLSLTAPTTLLTVISGQNGFLMAAFVIGGFRVLSRRPLLGGLILGGLAIKPQLAILVPIALVAAGQWRALMGLIAGALGLCLASLLAFGSSIWLAWVSEAPSLVRLLGENWRSIQSLQPTVAGALLSLGFGQSIARVSQIVSTLVVAGLLGSLFYKSAREGRGPQPLDAAALQVGAFLATPYAFIYDMPMVSSGAATAFDAFARAGRRWRPGEIGIFLASLAAPMVMQSGALKGAPIGAVSLALLFAVIVRAKWGGPAANLTRLGPLANA